MSLKNLEKVTRTLQKNAEKELELSKLIEEKKADLKRIIEDIKSAKIDLKDIQDQQYTLQEKELHIKEILRVAKIYFPQLRKESEGHITDADIAELDKWIGRTESMEGLKAIITAITSVGSKYKPENIRTNLYALIQKVIIEGPKDMRRKV